MEFFNMIWNAISTPNERLIDIFLIINTFFIEAPITFFIITNLFKISYTIYYITYIIKKINILFIEVIKMNNMNIDENTMKNIKNMVDNGNLSDAISNISPEMIQNFSKILSSQKEPNSQNAQQHEEPTPQNSTNTSSQSNNFDFSNLDINTIMKMSSVINKMKDNQNDPRANLLNSLKPYLRDSKKGQLDNYMNLLNVAKIAEIMKDNKENDNNV